MKAYGQPEKEEVDKLAQFVDKVVWGRLHTAKAPRMYGVKKSLFFYDPKVLPDYPVSARQLDVVDVVEQASRRRGQSRLRLPARGRRLLDDVSARAEPPGPRHRRRLGVVSRQGVQHREVHDRGFAKPGDAAASAT